MILSSLLSARLETDWLMSGGLHRKVKGCVCVCVHVYFGVTNTHKRVIVSSDRGKSLSSYLVDINIFLEWL